MKNFIYNNLKLLIMMIIFLSCLYMVSCNKENKLSEFVDENVLWSEYVVIRSDISSSDETNAAQLLRRTINETYGIDIKLQTDWINRGESLPEMGKEILVGKTNRPQSESALSELKFNDYKIYKDGERIVIIGGSDSATMKAVEKFISLYLNDDNKYSFPERIDEMFTYKYPINEINIDGKPINEFNIIYGSNDSWDSQYAAERIRDKIKEVSGIELNIIRDAAVSNNVNEIIIGDTNRVETKNFKNQLNENEYGFAVIDGKFIITGIDKSNFIYSIMEFENRYLSNPIEILDFGNGMIETGKIEYQQINIYVDSINGNDGNNGDITQPYKTISHTFNKINNIIKENPKDITVYLSDGNHYITEPLNIDGSEFGSALSKIEFRPMNNADTPVISAAISITNFREVEINGITMWEANLPTVTLEDGKSGYLNAHQAFNSDGVRLTRPRLPETGFYYVAGAPGYDNLFNAERTESMSAMNFNTGEIENLSNVEDIQIRMFHYWTDEMIGVNSIDVATNTITFKSPSIFSLRQDVAASKGAKYYLDNVFEELDNSGEYYIAYNSGLLYYVPFDGEDINSAVINLSGIDNILNISDWRGADYDNIVFNGITFADSDWKKISRTSSQAADDIAAAINIINSIGISFNNCSFTRIGNTAVYVQEGCNHINFDNCLFYDLGAGAIKIGGVNSENIDSDGVIHNINITNCTIEKYGRVYFNAVGILLKYAYDCNITNNVIHDGYYTGISCGWVWRYSHHVTHNILIENNHIYNIGQGLLSDMGGIYTLGLQPGTVIRKNIIHDIEMDNYGGWAIYTDEGSSDILIEKNICYNTTAQPFHQHYGENNIIRNNIFAFGDGGQMLITRKENHISVIFEKNILVSNGTAIYAKSPADMKFIEDFNLIWDYSGKPMSGYMVYDSVNKSYTFPDNNKLSAEYMIANGLYKNVLIADPLFKDPQNGDFTLSDNSPAWEIGFEPIFE